MVAILKNGIVNIIIGYDLGSSECKWTLVCLLLLLKIIENKRA